MPIEFDLDNSKISTFSQVIKVGIKIFQELLNTLNTFHNLVYVFIHELVECLDIEEIFVADKDIEMMMDHSKSIASVMQQANQDSVDEMKDKLLHIAKKHKLASQLMGLFSGDNKRISDVEELVLMPQLSTIKDKMFSIKNKNQSEYLRFLEAMKNVILIIMWGVACQKYIKGDKNQLYIQYDLMYADKNNINEVIQNIAAEGFSDAANLYQEIYYEMTIIKNVSNAEHHLSYQ